MTPAEVIEKYGVCADYARIKIWRKQTPPLVFTEEEVRQAALEGLMVYAGLCPGPPSTFNRMAKVEAEQPAHQHTRYAQHSLDWWVSGWCRNRRKAAAALAKREGISRGPLDVVPEVEFIDRTLRTRGLETSEITLADVAGRFPLLHMMHVEGMTREEICQAEGVNRKTYQKRSRLEREDFTEWAIANRRVAA